MGPRGAVRCQGAVESGKTREADTQDSEGADGEENPDFMPGLSLCVVQSGESYDCLGKPLPLAVSPSR